IGTYLYTSNNIITGCAVSDNVIGILLSGDSNTITSNYIARNEQGIFFGVNTPGDEPLNIVLTHNSFVDNDVHFSGCFCEGYNTTEAVHTWDDGKQGNYWQAWQFPADVL
ncbi:MAG: NosD domain-containing protein, partial [bacterium]